MQILLSLIFMVTALLFLFWSMRTPAILTEKIALVYASLFIIASMTLSFYYISQNKEALRGTFATLVFQKEKQGRSHLQLSNQKIKNKQRRDQVLLDAPLIEQLPELPRGCEVTSLSMLLAYNGINVDKLELANKIKKNPASYRKENGKIFFGNPNNGFVGDMYSFNTPGLGVYHKPIAALAKEYVKEASVLDFTGEDFEMILDQLNQNRVVWVIINSHYKQLPEHEFITWITEDGPMDITYREHSVLITGYDDRYIYFNDPLNYHHKATLDNFKKAWEQMGSQAITIY